MSSNIVKKLAAAAVAGAALSFGTLDANQAQAVTLTFDFTTEEESIAPSFEFTEGGLTLTATGSFTDLEGETSPRDVAQTVAGLGVTAGFGPLGLENAEVDGSGQSETLLLSFDGRARINSATFSRVGSLDEFTLLVDGDELVSADIPGGNLADVDIGSFDFTGFNAGDRTGAEFGFTVTDLDDGYILREITVETVPEPALVLGLLAASVLGGSVLQRKQK
jgi:hypothetical protein